MTHNVDVEFFAKLPVLAFKVQAGPVNHLYGCWKRFCEADDPTVANYISKRS